MALLTEIEFPGVSALQYEQASETAGVRADHLPVGMLCHVAIVSDSSLRLVNLWEAREKMETFGQIMKSATGEAHFPRPSAPGRITETYNYGVALL